MTGPDHYQAAEQLLDTLGGDGPVSQRVAAAAQVHATLALAAATALNTDTDGGLPASDYGSWIQAASEYSRGEQP